jgi:hypothetical protein
LALQPFKLRAVRVPRPASWWRFRLSQLLPEDYVAYNGGASDRAWLGKSRPGLSVQEKMDELSNFWIWTLIGGAIYVLVCGGFGSYVAKEKNRHWVEGFLFGAMLGPFGVIAAAALPTMGTARGQALTRGEDEDEHVDVSAALAARPVPIVPHSPRRLLGEVKVPKPRRPGASE